MFNSKRKNGKQEVNIETIKIWKEKAFYNLRNS